MAAASAIGHIPRPRCPVCNSRLDWCNISFQEELLMCINARCEYPFGYPEIQIRSVDKEEDKNNDTEASCSSSAPGANKKALSRRDKKKLKKNKKQMEAAMKKLQEDYEHLHLQAKEEITRIHLEKLNENNKN